jgi:hypothetical protein
MPNHTPSPPIPNAPSTALTNNKVVLALLAPPSPASPALHQCAGVMNLFCDGTKTDTNKMASNLLIYPGTKTMFVGFVADWLG